MVATTLKSVGLGLLLNWPLKSSIERTLFPTDSKKSVKILFENIISFEIVFVFWFRLFSVAKSKS